MSDSYNLRRFVDAQEPVFAHVLAELEEGRKRSHWMWFVFPQIAGLGSSPMARKFTITSLDEARAYLADSILGSRLKTCTQLTLQVDRRSINEIFGFPDDMKFRSSMTLFSDADPRTSIFAEALRKYFGGQSDPETLKRL